MDDFESQANSRVIQSNIKNSLMNRNRNPGRDFHKKRERAAKAKKKLIDNNFNMDTSPFRAISPENVGKFNSHDSLFKIKSFKSLQGKNHHHEKFLPKVVNGKIQKSKLKYEYVPKRRTNKFGIKINKSLNRQERKIDDNLNHLSSPNNYSKFKNNNQIHSKLIQRRKPENPTRTKMILREIPLLKNKPLDLSLEHLGPEIVTSSNEYKKMYSEYENSDNYIIKKTEIEDSYDSCLNVRIY